MEHIEIHNDLDKSLDKQELTLLLESKIDFSHNKNLEGGTEVLELVFYYTPLAIGVIAKIILSRIKSNRYKYIKINGKKISEFNDIEIGGISEKTIKEILNNHLNTFDGD